MINVCPIFMSSPQRNSSTLFARDIEIGNEYFKYSDYYSFFLHTIILIDIDFLTNLLYHKKCINRDRCKDHYQNLYAI